MRYQNLKWISDGAVGSQKGFHAGFIARLFAFAIDIFIILILATSLTPPLQIFFKNELPGFLKGDKIPAGLSPYLPSGIESPGLFGIMLLALALLYFSLLHSSENQRTVGKWLVGIYVGDKLGDRISPGTAFLRFCCYAISALPAGAGFLMVIFMKEKKALHDVLTGTRVFRGNPLKGNWVGSEEDYINLYTKKNQHLRKAVKVKAAKEGW